MTPVAARALETPPAATLASCAAIADNVQRLICFDRLAAASVRAADGAPAPAAVVPTAVMPVVSAEKAAEMAGAAHPTASERAKAALPEPYTLADRWELGADHKRGVFAFRAYRQNYLLATYSSAPNNTPYQPFAAQVADNHGLSKSEIAFQLSFKMKMLESLTPLKADLWFAYTQQSFWQAYNHAASSAFRETNYQPELILTLPIDVALGPAHARLLNLGFVHQSNGQASTLSRSWNRVYLQTGIESGPVVVMARAWRRLPERRDDDNPGITDSMGYGDVQLTYRVDGHEFSVLGRRNMHTGRGALQAGWVFPLINQLKGTVQFFSGYGQSLIDYNYAQKSIGAGLTLGF